MIQIKHCNKKKPSQILSNHSCIHVSSLFCIWHGYIHSIFCKSSRCPKLDGYAISRHFDLFWGTVIKNRFSVCREFSKLNRSWNFHFFQPIFYNYRIWIHSQTKKFNNEISWFLEAEKNHEILLIKIFCLTINSNSDAIFVFTEVDLDNRILIRGRNSDLEFSTSSTARPKLWRPWGKKWEENFGPKNGMWPRGRPPQPW